MLLTAKLVDEVHYNERGNEVFLVKHLDKLRVRKPAPVATGSQKRVLPFSGKGAARSLMKVAYATR